MSLNCDNVSTYEENLLYFIENKRLGYLQIRR